MPGDIGAGLCQIADGNVRRSGAGTAHDEHIVNSRWRHGTHRTIAAEAEDQVIDTG